MPGGKSQEPYGVPRWARYAFSGALVGVVAALAALFVMTIYYGYTLGMGAQECVVYGCAMTVLLSQPAGLIGVLAGATVGLICGAVIQLFVRRRKHQPAHGMPSPK